MPPLGVTTDGGTNSVEATSPAEPCTASMLAPVWAARLVMPASGVIAWPEASGTLAEPPVTNTASSPVGPISAILRSRFDKGRTLSSFFSSTVPASATWVATCWCCGVETSVDGVAGSGLSNNPESKIANRIRRSMSSRRAAEI